MQPDQPQPADSQPKQQSGVPRRYGVGTLLVITTAYALLFGLLASVNAHPAVFVGIALFLTTIGLSQALLFGGKKPREASILVGAGLGMVLIVVALVAATVVEGVRPSRSTGLPLAVIISPVYGAILGYLSGCLIGGMFLVMDRVRGRRM